jgi:hypothetical protein
VEGGYYVNVSQLFKYMAATVVEAGEQYEEENFERHLCGKACLMQCLNAEVDRISSMSAHNPLWEVEA